MLVARDGPTISKIEVAFTDWRWLGGKNECGEPVPNGSGRLSGVITFLTSAKPFRGTVGQNQVRAIQSWLAAVPEGEVILYGRSEGVEEICGQLGAHFVPNIECAPSGVPYFNALVSDASERARHDLQVYLNCDIILTSSIVAAVRRATFPRYLMVGQRIDLDENAQIDVLSGDWRRQLSDLASAGKATLHGPGGMDYFVFPRDMWRNLKSLIIGRAAYDTALVAYCLRNRIPVIDCTLAVVALHQFHGYGHVRGGDEWVRYGPEGEQNRKLHGITFSSPNTADAGWMLRDGELIRSHCRGDVLREFELRLRFVWKLGPSWMVMRALWQLLVAVGLYHPPTFSFEYVLAELVASERGVNDVGAK